MHRIFQILRIQEQSGRVWSWTLYVLSMIAGDKQQVSLIRWVRAGVWSEQWKSVHLIDRRIRQTVTQAWRAKLKCSSLLWTSPFSELWEEDFVGFRSGAPFSSKRFRNLRSAVWQRLNGLIIVGQRVCEAAQHLLECVHGTCSVKGYVFNNLFCTFLLKCTEINVALFDNKWQTAKEKPNRREQDESFQFIQYFPEGSNVATLAGW